MRLNIRQYQRIKIYFSIILVFVGNLLIAVLYCGEGCALGIIFTICCGKPIGHCMRCMCCMCSVFYDKPDPLQWGISPYAYSPYVLRKIKIDRATSECTIYTCAASYHARSYACSPYAVEGRSVMV